MPAAPMCRLPVLAKSLLLSCGLLSGNALMLLFLLPKWPLLLVRLLLKGSFCLAIIFGTVRDPSPRLPPPLLLLLLLMLLLPPLPLPLPLPPLPLPLLLLLLLLPPPPPPSQISDVILELRQSRAPA